MLKKTVALLSLCLSSCVTFAAEIPPPPTQLIDDTLQYAVIPIYQQFVEQATLLQKQVATFCATPNDTAQFSATQQAFHATLTAWMRTQAIRFGAVKLHNMDSKILFFPDRKDTVKLKVTTLLNADTPLTLAQVEKQGSTALGLSALEILLFEPAEQTLNTFADGKRCAYINIASTALAQDANDLLTQAKSAEKPTITHIVASLIELTEIMKDSKLGAPLGRKNGNMIKPFFAESWRSHASLTNLQANLEGLQQVYSAGQGYGLDDYLKAVKQDELDTEIQQEIQATIQAIQAFSVPLTEALSAKGEERAKVERLFFELDILTRLFKTNLTEALHITTGFNSLDGD
ncbi:imelysin family protein [Beggiatoa leptomitoformis]|uniref:Imelysin-like domain-containing protein n=1 Tax=Beggiatoa leptomitoformis TaxID=288004 RepID=A0A2N9Y9U5_9GAMM|nr:imelysin family protein [Beggiatoa leptomitoformis]ALG67329.1 hypothetical protein AL038_05935 [Beggiatoa leptomitoformis]AUI67234.1 hypothetical protein BLE401_00035 [Beggiatoa leptomitoformis]